MSDGLWLHPLAFKHQQDSSFLTTPGQLTALQSSTELAQDFVQEQASRWAALCAASSAVKTGPETHPLSHKPPSVFLAQRKQRGEDGMAITVSELLPIPVSSASLEDEERSRAHTHCSSHTSPFMPALLMKKAAEFISTNLKEEGGQTETGVQFLLPHMSSLFTSKEKPNPLFAQFPPPSFSLSSYISKNNSL